ncbi:MAG: helix-turn-helix domain-containing protein [Actinomycetota bacterium]|nr:helix-turn-helix domain-containing protein [Actinomycetota bacterium]
MTSYDRGEYDALPEVLTTAQAARLLNMSEQKIRRGARTGEIPSTLIGRSLRFSKTKLASWVAHG